MAEPQGGVLTHAFSHLPTSISPLQLHFSPPSPFPGAPKAAFTSRPPLCGVTSFRELTWSNGVGIHLSPKSFASSDIALRQPQVFPLGRQTTKQQAVLQVRAAGESSEGVRWWQKGSVSNMRDINSTQEFLDSLSNAGEKLVVVEFFATWCGSCKALYPKLCQIAAEHPDIEFLKVNFDENKVMCKSLNVKVLPFFHFYRGADGKLDSFSCSLSKLQKLRDAIAKHNTDRCSIGPPLGLGEESNKLGSSTPATAGSAV